MTRQFAPWVDRLAAILSNTLLVISVPVVAVAFVAQSL